MSMSRDEIHRRALRAALAVTGRAHRGLTPAIGAALVTAACSAPQTTQPSPSDEQTTTESDAAPADATADATEDGSAEPTPAPESCVSDTTNKTDWRCCIEYGLEPEGCGRCDSPERVACLSCVSESEQFGNMECCSALYDMNRMDDAFAAGCTPWGPPAPPEWVGLTLDEIFALEEAA